MASVAIELSDIYNVTFSDRITNTLVMSTYQIVLFPSQDHEAHDQSSIQNAYKIMTTLFFKKVMKFKKNLTHAFIAHTHRRTYTQYMINSCLTSDSFQIPKKNDNYIYVSINA